jgi:mannose-1-phosphate guanylyltransferase
MLQDTVDRLTPMIPAENILVITGGAHAATVARQLPELPDSNIIVEPGARGTGPAIGLGAALIARKDPDAIMGSFAADHYVTEPRVFQEAVAVATRVAAEGYLVTLGIKPSYPETGYGYIKSGAKLSDHGDFEVHEVDEFKEKPDLATAEHYVQSGRYLWNASMFIWRASTLLDEMRTLLPDLYEVLIEIAEHWDTPQQAAVIERLWPGLQDVTIDHGIMEKAEHVAVVPVEFGWTDLGDWHSLAEVLAANENENVALGATHIAVDTRSTLVFGQGRTIATLGVENLVIVDTDDVVLVCDRARAQDVRKIVQRLKEIHRDELT